MSPARSIFFDEHELGDYCAASATPAKVPDHVYQDYYGTYCVKGIIQFIQTHYSDRILAEVLADLHKMAIDSCSTLTAIATGDHPPLGRGFYCRMSFHPWMARQLPFGQKAYDEYLELGLSTRWASVSEYLRYRRLEPFLHEEMARRLRRSAVVPVELNKEGV